MNLISMVWQTNTPNLATFPNTGYPGDEDVVADLESKTANFDVQKWWQDHEALETPLKLQGKSTPGKTTQFHNPRAGDTRSWQLTETVDAFLSRLPPATTEQTPGHDWIWICNPYIKRKSQAEAENQLVRGGEDEAPEDEGADLARLMQAGEERLHFASSFIAQSSQTPGVSKTLATREAKKAGLDAAKDILELAKGLRVTCGKVRCPPKLPSHTVISLKSKQWMLFCSAFEVNDVWEAIAKATANNELGIAAKVAPKNNSDQRTERLICVYTVDFSDKKDVTRVAKKLKQLGLTKNKPLYYKPGQFHLPILRWY